jgi:hypothetical protein
MSLEERTIDCSNVAKTDQCLLVAPKAKVVRDPGNYKCHREPMPQHAWNPLAKNSETRLACPIACEPDADLSVVFINKCFQIAINLLGDSKTTN